MNELELYYKAKKAYYDGDPIMCDDAFDYFERKLVKTNPEILLSVGASERAGKTKLPHPMGSLNQVHDQRELQLWLDKNSGNKIILEKIDGNSCLLEYKDGKFANSYSRGDGINGANNSRHLIHTSIPKFINSFTGTIRGELVIPKRNWLQVKELAESNSGKVFANSRNFIAGFLNSSRSLAAIYPYIEFVAFDIYSDHFNKENKFDNLATLMRAGFTVPKHKIVTVPTYSTLELEMQELIEDSLYELDGIVVENNEAKYRDLEIDLDDLNPSYAVKIKPKSAGAVSTVTGVEWNVSKDGLLKPVVHFDPVSLTGVTITKASGYNARNVVDSGIGIGASVLITRRGDVIPCVEKVLVPAEVVLPANSTWDANNVELLANNEESNFDVTARKLEYFFSKLNVDHMGPANVLTLVNSGIDTPVKAIKASIKMYEQCIGANGIKAYDILHNILRSVTPELLFAAFDSLGRGIGERKIRALLDVIPLNKFLSGDVTASEIVAIHGFEEKTAKLIIKNLPIALEQYKQVADIIAFETNTTPEVTGGVLSGEVICATGVRIKDDVLNKVIAAGGTVVDSLTSSVTILVAKDKSSTSSKIEKARAKGVKIISLNELHLMLP
jgi:DNA ligase (NAD+)